MGFYSAEPLTSKSEAPPLFDGTTRLWISTRCPFAQRVWIAVNYKRETHYDLHFIPPSTNQGGPEKQAVGLNDAIQIVTIDLADRPAWYKEKVYAPNKVPSLEYKNKVTGESLDLLEFLDVHFEGPKLAPEDAVKKEDAAVLLKRADAFTQAGYGSLRLKDATPADAEALIAPELDYLETALEKYSKSGPFFLGEFGVVDAALAPFLERFQLLFKDFYQYDITAGRPNLKKWFEAVNKVDAYTQTKIDPQVLISQMKKYMGGQIRQPAAKAVKT